MRNLLHLHLHVSHHVVSIFLVLNQMCQLGAKLFYLLVFCSNQLIKIALESVHLIFYLLGKSFFFNLVKLLYILDLSVIPSWGLIKQKNCELPDLFDTFRKGVRNTDEDPQNGAHVPREFFHRKIKIFLSDKSWKRTIHSFYLRIHFYISHLLRSRNRCRNNIVCKLERGWKMR